METTEFRAPAFPTMKSYRRFHAAAFTLVEMMVAIGMFGIAAAASIEALLRMNLRAALCRLQTGASTVAQNQIDLVLSDSPFNPQLTNQTPPELTLGTTYNGSSTAPTVPVYTDPISNAQVLGWTQTTVANVNASENGSSLYIYQVTVTVNYNYKGKPYSVTLSTMRASDI